MPQGTVKFFNKKSKFGFIRDNDTGEEYYVSIKGLIDEVTEGDKVSFELKQGRKGLNAYDVKLLED
jgi:CspA family cold shock protein